MKWSPFTLRTGLFLSLFTFLNPANAEWLKQARDIMGTRVLVELWQPNDAANASCIQNVFAEMHRIDELMSPYKENSEISVINRNAALKPVTLSSELNALINKSIEFSRLSQGAFDISFASIGFRYDYRNRIQPDNTEIQRSLNSVDYRKLKMENHSIHFSEPGMRIDLGGIAKGYAVDRAISILEKCGVNNAIVSAGGDSRILGSRRMRPWMMGIQHPRDKKKIALTLPLSNSAISTSGDYERYFLTDNERIHHIINPATGKSAKKSWSASVIGPDATSTDALSTTVFILGAKKGIQLIDSLDDMDAVIIDAEGKVHYSSGLVNPQQIENQP